MPLPKMPKIKPKSVAKNTVTKVTKQPGKMPPKKSGKQEEEAPEEEE